MTEQRQFTDDFFFAYTYDPADRLTNFSDGNISYQYAYNGPGNRLQQTTIYALDLNAGLPQVLSDGTYTYLYGYDRIAQSGVNGIEYFLPDGQMADGVGGVTLSQSFTPYGELLARGGIGSTAYDFAGEWTDPSGLQYLRARYYAPSTGRFISRDVWEGDTEAPMSYNAWLYGYANPVMYTDPSGNVPGIPDPVPAKIILTRYIDNGYDEKLPPPGVSFEPVTTLQFFSGIPSKNQAQFISIISSRRSNLPSDNEQGSPTTGLCGDISILWIFENYGQIENIYEMYWAHYDFLQNNEVYTNGIRDYDVEYSSASELARFINKTYPVFEAKNGQFENFPEAVKEVRHGLMNNGPYYIVGVNINGNSGQLRDGKSKKFESSSNTMHWVVINGLSRGYGNENDMSPILWIRIYNPFDNGLEYYWWSDFKNSWDKNYKTYVSVNIKR